MAQFGVGDRVIISPEFFWAKNATGTISTPPPEVMALSGPWKDGVTRQEGAHTVYWVWFDEPQFDADGDGPYRGAGIWESALSLLEQTAN